MIFSGILKYWKNILDVLLIVGGIVFLFLWNPFNIFGAGTKLQNTANMLGEIKEIGQLVTAEYYGEIITTYRDSKLEILTGSKSDSLEDAARDLYISLKKQIYIDYSDAIDSLANIKRRGARRKFSKKINELATEEAFEFLNSYYFSDDNNLADNVLMFLKRDEFKENFRKKQFKEKSKEGDFKFWSDFRRNQLKNILSEIKKVKQTENQNRIDSFLQLGFKTTTTFVDFDKWYRTGNLSRDDQKTELAIIGRGSVKAGFDFGSLDKSNVVYDEDRQVVHFFGFNATILTADINPWFIPERKVPGFEILSDKRANFEKVRETKIHAVDKLEAKAREAGIIKTAQENGEEALRNFFMLITGDDIKEVVFHQDGLIYEAESILKGDATISLDELFTIDELVNKNIEAIAREKNKAIKERRQQLLKNFLADLQNDVDIVGWDKESDRIPFNYYNRHIPIILIDSVITEDERELIASLRYDFVKTDSGKSIFNPIDQTHAQYYWLKHELSFVYEYNEFLRLLRKSLDGIAGNAPFKNESLEYLLVTALAPNTVKNEELMTKLKGEEPSSTSIVHPRIVGDSVEYVVRKPIGLQRYAVTNAFANVAPIGNQGFVLKPWKTFKFDTLSRAEVEVELKKQVKDNLKKGIVFTYQFVGENEYIYKSIPATEYEILNLVREKEFDGINAVSVTSDSVIGFGYTEFTFDLTSGTLSSTFELDKSIFSSDLTPDSLAIQSLPIIVNPDRKKFTFRGVEYDLSDSISIPLNADLNFRILGIESAWKINRKRSSEELKKILASNIGAVLADEKKEKERMENRLLIQFIDRQELTYNQSTREILALRNYMFDMNYKSFDVSSVKRASTWLRTNVLGERSNSELRDAIKQELGNAKSVIRNLR